MVAGYWMQVAGGTLVLLGLGRTWWVWSIDPVRKGTAKVGRRIRSRFSRANPAGSTIDPSVVPSAPSSADPAPAVPGENATAYDVAVWAQARFQHEHEQLKQVEERLRAGFAAAEGRTLTAVDGVRQEATSQLTRQGHMIERAALGGLGAAALGGLLAVIGLLLQGAPTA